MRRDNDADPFVVVLKYVIISLTLWMNTAPPFHKHYSKFDKIFVPDKLFSEPICINLFILFSL